MKAYIGDVMVLPAEPPLGNPYTSVGVQLTGEERAQALSDFKHGRLNARNYTFWHAPAEGGAIVIESPSEIDWDTSRIQ